MVAFGWKMDEKGPKEKRKSRRRVGAGYPLHLMTYSIVLICCLAFVINSYKNLLKWWEGNTLITESWVLPNTLRLALPTLTLCPRSHPRANGSLDDKEILQIEDIILCRKEENKTGCMQKLSPQVAADSSFVNFSEHAVIHTKYRGRCFTLNLPEVEDHGRLLVHLKPLDWKLYFHEPGDEFFLHLGTFPGSSPAFLPLPHWMIDSVITVKITKTQTENLASCKHWSRADQIDCIRENLRRDVEQSEINCTRPWINSMFMPNPPALNICQVDTNLTGHIRSRLETHFYATCQEPCTHVRYKLSVDHLDDESEKGRIVVLQYNTIATKVMRTIPVSSINDCISNVGGNLGLFLDFSLISLLLSLLNKAMPRTN